MPKAKPSSTVRAPTKMTTSGGKKLSAYNQFMKTELPKYKAKHPETSHKDAFKEVAQMWKSSPANPNKA